jgi:predicted Holliday junction resolvase-like endonuclease
MEVLALCGIIVILMIAVIYLFKQNVKLSINHSKFEDGFKELQSDVISLQDELGEEREKNRALLSQKKSSETRLGQISEHLVPFLQNCTHDPKQMHFLGNPIDYLVFDFDDGKITFLEVKSGNSKPSKRQKTIKNIIKSGRIYYEELRINERGIRNKIVSGEETPEVIVETSGEDDAGED